MCDPFSKDPYIDNSCNFEGFLNATLGAVLGAGILGLHHGKKKIIFTH